MTRFVESCVIILLLEEAPAVSPTLLKESTMI